MRVDVPVIDNEARDYMNEQMRGVFVAEGETGLQEVAAEILNDEGLHHFLLTHLPNGHGLKLGSMSFFEDLSFDVPYGLTIKFEQLPRQTKFFYYVEFLGHPREEF